MQLTCGEAFYGGAAGGGKSDALLIAALQYVCLPGYAAILFRRTYPQLEQPGGLIPRSKEWLTGTGAVYNQQTHTWTFPSGAVLKLSHLQYEDTVYDHQSSEYQFIGFDELTHFAESQVRYMFSRLRRKTDVTIPLRMRAASNPGGVGHDWVKRRYVDSETRKDGVVFIPARLEDNPHLDTAEYEVSLSHLTQTEQARLRDGDWDAAIEGTTFKREWFHQIQSDPPAKLKLCRFWDMAATEPKKGKDPDYTAGALLGRSKDGIWYLLDMQRFRDTPRVNEQRIEQQAHVDGRGIRIRMEQEGGASGKTVIDSYRRGVLMGFDFKGIPATGSKELRANPLSAAAEAGNLILITGGWVQDFIDEAAAFPGGSHDDQIDAVSGAMNDLASRFIHPGISYDETKARKERAETKESASEAESRMMDDESCWTGGGGDDW